MSRSPNIRTYGMRQRSDRADFYIRDKSGRPALTAPHRHDYFQIQINLGGDTVQHIGGAVRAFPRNALAFILPHHLHLIPHPEDSAFLLVNFAPEFLLPHLPCDPLALEDIALADAPELAPFRFQEHLDFILDEDDFAQVLALLRQMRELDRDRQLGSVAMLRGLLLQLLGLVCNRFETPLLALSTGGASRRGRRDALGRVKRYIRAQLGNPALNLKDAADAAFLSPNYLTHLLRKETGSGFSELVLEGRMRLARAQLTTTDQPIGRIATQCGFADEAYFSRRFRQIHGIPPGQFRRQQGAAALPGS